MTELTPLHILRLTSSAYKRLSASGVTIELDGTLTEISGANGAGKSSFLDSFAALFGGKKFMDPQPIKDGENTAVIEADLGHMGKPEYHLRRTITRVIKSGKQDAFRTALTVTTPDGAVISNGHELLVEWLGDTDLAFDPLACTRFNDAAQVSKIQCMVPLSEADGTPFNLDLWEQERKELELVRRDAGRDLKRAEGALSPEITPRFPDAPKAMVDTADLARQLEEVNELRRQHDQRGADLITDETQLTGMQDQRAQYIQQISGLQEQIKQDEQRVSDLRQTVTEHDLQMGDLSGTITRNAKLHHDSVLPSADALLLQMSNAQQVNVEVSANNRYKLVETQVQDAQAHHDLQDEKYKAHEQHRRQVISRAEYPDGVSIELNHLDKPCVAFNGRSLNQASQSEQMRVWMSIAMRGDQRIKILLVHEASLMDPQSMAEFRHMLEEYDCKAVCEVVDTTGNRGWMIEDGALAEPGEDDVLSPEMALFTEGVSVEGNDGSD